MISKRFENYFKNNYGWRQRDNALVRKEDSGTMKKVTPRQISNTWISLCDMSGVPAEETEKEIVDWITKATPNKMAAAKPKIAIPNLSMASSWIFEKLNDPSCPFTLSKRADTITFGDADTSSNDAGVLAWLNQKVRDLDLKKAYTVGDISDGWSLLKLHYLSSQKLYLREKFKYDGNPFIDEFIKYLYAYLQVKEDYDVFEMIFKHWLWCLKRRIFGLPVIWHVWINFNGAQGIGKTQMLTRMFKTFEDFTVMTNLRIMNDVEREYRKFTDNYVIIFDDLNTGENSDSDVSLNDNAVDAIKQLMTQEILTIRSFHTQDQIRVKNTFIPISTANRHLYDVIYDGDAMRRWFEFNCQRSTPPSSYDELNAVLERFPEVLAGIDETNDVGYWKRDTPTGKKVIEIQKHYIPTNTSTNTWIDYCEVTPDYDRSDDTALMAPEYKQYSTYCRAVGKHAAGLQRVTMIISRLWPDCIDDRGVAHVFIEKKVDETNGKLIENESAKRRPTAIENNYIPKLEGSNLSFKYEKKA